MSEIVKDGDTCTVKPGKDVVVAVAKDLKRELQSLVEQRPRELIVDLTGVDIIESAGIAALIATNKSVSEVGGKLKIINASRKLYDLFKMMALDQHLDIHWISD